MSFWNSELGEVSGSPEAAYTQSFTTGVIPNDTMALAEILKYSAKEYNGKEYYQIDWKLTDGEYKGRVVFQKIHAFDIDPKKRHTALNMMKLIYNMFHVKPKNDSVPVDSDLMIFIGKLAGIKIQEWDAIVNGEPKSGNWVSEVHPASGFKCETGTKAPDKTIANSSGVNSALNRNAARKSDASIDDDADIPF